MESYKVGDTVVIDVYNKRATIEKFNGERASDSGYLYTVLTEDGEYKVVSSTFFTKKTTPNYQTNELTIEEKRNLVDKEINRLIHELGLISSENSIVQLRNCCKLQEYIILNFTYTEEIMEEKESTSPDNLIIEELYNALILKKSVCTSNSIVFKEVLRRIGMNVKTIGLTNKVTGGLHFSNLVLLDGLYYFFDATTDQNIYNTQNVTTEVVLCCAGLGINTYGENYEPQVELISPNAPTIALPNNIASTDIPNEIVNEPICQKMGL